MNCKISYVKAILLYFAFLITDSHQTIGIFYEVSGYFNISLCFLFVILSMLYVFSERNVGLKLSVLSTSFVFSIYLMYNVEVDSNLGMIKLITLTSTLFILTISRDAILRNRDVVDTFLKFIIAFSSVKVMLFLIFVDISFFHLLTNPSEVRFQYSLFLNPIYLARSCGLAIIAMMFLKSSGIYKYSIPIYFILLMGLYISGSRAPIIALFAVFIVQYIYSDKKHKLITFLISSSFLMVIAALFYVEIYEMAQSFIIRDNSSLDSAVEDRFGLILIAIEMFEKNIFFGEGLGSFSNYSYLGYPHNLIVEVLSELGVVGGLFLLLVIVSGVRLPRTDVFFLMFLFAFINSLSSGSLSNNVVILIMVILGGYVKDKYVTN